MTLSRLHACQVGTRRRIWARSAAIASLTCACHPDYHELGVHGPACGGSAVSISPSAVIGDGVRPLGGST